MSLADLAPRPRHTADPWVGRLRWCAERRSAEAAFLFDAIAGYPGDGRPPTRSLAGSPDDWSPYGLCESPIEAAMLGALCAVAAEYGLSPQVIGGEANFTPYRLHGPRLAIAPQLHIGKRRVDLLVVRLHPWVDYGIAVECDGAAFHGPGTEKHDRAREAEIIREFQAEYAGNTRPTKPTSDRVRFMRFAGRAIWADAFACAEAVILALGE